MQQDWIHGLLGGGLIGIAGAIYLLVNGRIMGASGILGGLVDGSGRATWTERAAFIAGLVLVPITLVPLYTEVDTHISPNLAVVVVAGLLVGVGIAAGQWLYLGARGLRHLAPVAAGHRGDGVLPAGGRVFGFDVQAYSGGDLMRAFFALIAGGTFGAGLLISGMTDTRKVQGWLDVFGNWDPTLAFVLGGAILPMAIAWRFTMGRAPSLGGTFPPPPEPKLGHNLVVGSVLFGMGWGLAGLCPGPAMASLSYGGIGGLVFLAAMIVGMIASPPVRQRLDALAGSS